MNDLFTTVGREGGPFPVVPQTSKKRAQALVKFANQIQPGLTIWKLVEDG